MICGLCKREVFRAYLVKEKMICHLCYGRPFMDVAKLGRKVFLRNYGWVEENRIEGVKSRTILPYNKEGGYYLGRRERSGKISEKAPSY